MGIGRKTLGGIVVGCVLSFGSGDANADNIRKVGEVSESVSIMEKKSSTYSASLAVLAGSLLGSTAYCWSKTARRISDYVAGETRRAVLGINSNF